MTDKAPVNAPAIAVLPLLLIWMTAILPFYHPNMGGSGGAAAKYSGLGRHGAHHADNDLHRLPRPRPSFAYSYRTPVIARHRRAGAAAAVYPPRMARRCPVALHRFVRRLAVLCRLPAAAPNSPAARAVAVRPAVRHRRSGAIGSSAAVRPNFGWVAPNGSRVYGVFQQPNVLGSFIATGLATALWLLLAPLSAPTWRRQLRCSRCWLLSPPCWC